MDISFYNINYSVLTKKEFKSSLGLKNSSLSSANKNLTIRERVSEFLKKPLFPDKSPPEHTQILSNVSGHLQKGSMLAILGSSGCGKTTILNVLSGRIKMSSTFYSHANHTDTLTGGIYFNGKPAANSSIGNSKIGVKERRMDLKKTPKNPKPNLLLKYVHQDDAFLPFLTVRETLEYSYALKRHVPLKSVPQKAITAILTQLRLLKVADNKVGNALQRGISGGERRRLSIGVELVTEPQMLFLDEPTSGLDSVNAVRVVEVIKSLTIDNKCTVFMSIHQPSSTLFHLFDQLLLLDKGRVVYLGPALASIDYFKENGYECPLYMNPTEFMLDIVLRDDEPEEEAEIRNLAGSLPATKPPQNSTVGAFTDACNVIDIPEFSEIAATTNNKGSKGARIEPEDRQRLSVIIPRRKPDFSLLYLQSVTFKSILEGIYQSTRIPELRSLCPASQEHVEELYDSSSLAPNDNTCNINFSSASYSSSFLEINTLIHRTWKDTRRNPSIAYIRTIAALLIAVLVGIIFFQLPNNNTSSGNRINSLLFLMCVFSLFCLPAISKLIEDRLLFYRERDAGVYSTWSYFVAEAVVELPILFSIAWVYGTVSYWMVGLQPTAANFFFFLAIISLVINVGFSLSQAIAAGVRTTNMAIAVYMIVLVYSLLLGGFMISKDNLPSGMQWLINTSYFFYGFESLVINEFELKNYGDDNLKVLEFQGDGKFTDLGALCVFFLGFRLIAYLLLRFKRIEKII